MTKFILSLFVFVSLAHGTAFAGDTPRKIDFTQLLLDADDHPFAECVKADPADKTKCAEEKQLTLGYVALQALNSPEQNITYSEAAKRGQLGLMVYRSNGAELTADEITLIKTQLPKRWSPLVVARAVPLLDPVSK